MHCLTIFTSLIFAQDFSKARRRVCGSMKRRDLFQALVPEEQIILAKLSRHIFEPGSRRLYFVSIRLLVFSEFYSAGLSIRPAE